MCCFFAVAAALLTGDRFESRRASPRRRATLRVRAHSEPKHEANISKSRLRPVTGWATMVSRCVATCQTSSRQQSSSVAPRGYERWTGQF